MYKLKARGTGLVKAENGYTVWKSPLQNITKVYATTNDM
jgi:hypothetical protein